MAYTAEPSLPAAGWARGSLRFQLFALLVGFSLGPMLVTNAWGYFQTRERLTTAAVQNVRNVSALEAVQTMEFLHSRQELLASTAAGNRYLNSLVQVMGSASTPTLREDYAYRLREHLRVKVAESPSAIELLVIDAAGVVLATSDDAGGAVPLDRVTTCLWARSDNTIIDGPGYSPGTNDVRQPTFIHSVPLRMRDREIGTLCGRFHLDIRREFVRAHEEQITSADIYLVDAAGRRLCCSADDSDAIYGQYVDPEALTVVAAGAPWVGRYAAGVGPVIAAYTPMPQLGWGILVELSDAKALASIERLKWQALTLGALFVALMVPAMFATARATAAPLHALADAARRVASGGLGGLVPEVGATEMVQLARSFNQMSGALREAHDTLERRIDERTVELRRSQDFTELLLDSIEQRVLVIDRSMIILKANRATVRLHGESPVGHTCHEFMTGSDAPCEGCSICEVFETGQPSRAEVTERTARGKDIFQLDTFPVLKGDGQVDAVVQIGRVITGEKQLMAQTMHHEKMAAFGLLAAGMAHEIGNPLASIQSQLQLVREMPDSERARETIPVVERQVMRMSTMLRELTDFARRKRDEVVLVSVGQVMGDAVRLLRHDPRARGVEIIADAAADLPGVRAREDPLVQVLLNLGINAVDAMPDGGVLRFMGRLEGSEIVVRVQDTGGGIPSEVQLRLFEPFLSTKERGRGTGLGLFVSRGIVEGLGGTLQLERTGPDGTVFTVHLPLEMIG